VEDFVKVAAVSPRLFLGDVQANVEHIATLIEEEEEAAILLFPELSLCGYTLGDLLPSQTLEEAIWHGLHELATFLRERIAIVGAPIWYEGRLYNCAIVLADGQIQGFVPKSYLANYREFYEKRWFHSGLGISGELEGIPFGSDLLFRAGPLLFGIEICEDLWSPIPPSLFMVTAGAQIIFNLSASNELVGKHAYRQELVRTQSARGICGYVYASSGIWESSADLCYSGATLIAENGLLLAEGERFCLEDVVIRADIDIDKLKRIRQVESAFHDTPTKPFRTVNLPPLPPTQVHRTFDPHPFIPKGRSQRHQRCQEIFAIQSSALARRIAHIGKETKLVIGVSGGLDSTLALLVSARSCQILKKPTEHIIAVTMPGLGTSSQTRRDGAALAQTLGATFREIPISQAAKAHLEAIGHDGSPDITLENAQARERTQILMDIANMEGGVVVGTADLSELALGFTTYNGDQMAMYHVNAGIPKTLVRYLIEWVADREPHLAPILTSIIQRPISPELLPTDGDRIEQKSEEIIGPYELHDFFLYHFLKYGATPKKILFMATRAFAGRYDQATIKQWLILFLRRFFANQFKRDAMPDGVKVGTIALSPRGDWRMPSDALVRLWIEELE